MMSDDRFDRVMALFEEALDEPASRRRAWLGEACPDDVSLRLEVERLLNAHDGTGLLDSGRDDLGSVFEDDLERPLPARVGPFEPIEEIGRGGMGIVYKAQDPRLGRFVAVKLLPPVLEDDPSARHRLLREARAASALDHPNVCTIYDVGETADGLVYIAMAYYAGRTLAELIQRGPLSVPEAVGIGRQIALGLAHAHDAGVVHQDVKPGNIVITDEGIVKILDFGIAKREGGSEVTTPGFHLGTIAYMSPERIDGSDSGPAMDIWSLGVVLAEMVTGRKPFVGSNAAEVVRAIELGLPAVEALPDDLKSICLAALARDPADRLPSAAAMAEALSGAGASGAAPRLPAETTSFVGRREEIDLASDLLSRARLVTITGPGGTGKTRVALALARREANRFRDGAHFVALESLDDPDLVVPAIVKSLSLGDPRVATVERLIRSLEKKELLLVLDNFEQVTAAGRAVAELLGACPTLSVVVTSRTLLQISGEHELPLTPLDDEAARELFVTRARAASPHFSLSETNAGDVAEICRRLDGLPLAIELAAARVRIFTPRSLLARLDTEMEQGGPRDRPERQRTIGSTIAWSYELLDEEEKRVFRGLGIFAGSFSMEAAEHVVGPGPGPAGLVDQSLVHAGGDGRFAMLRTVRRFARERLEASAELESTCARHRDYFLALAERAAPELTGPRQTYWLDRLDEEQDELRTLVVRGGETALRLASALWRFWLVRGHLREGRRRLEALLEPARSCPDESLAASILNGAGTLAHNAGDNGRARELLEESLALWRRRGDVCGTAVALNNLAWVACEQSDLGEAVRLSEEALVLHRELSDRRGMALSLNNLGWVANYRGEGESARAYHAESLALRREIGDQRGVAFALANLAWAELLGGSLERAARQLDEAEALIARVGDPIVMGWTLTTKGRLLLRHGALADAAGTLGRALLEWHEGGQSSGRAWTLTELARISVLLGRGPAARELAAAALEQWRVVGSVWGEAYLKQVLASVEAEEGHLERAALLREESRAVFERLGAKA